MRLQGLADGLQTNFGQQVHTFGRHTQTTSTQGDLFDATLGGTIADLSMLADRSSGAATFTATANGALPYPDLDATIEVENKLSPTRIEPL